MNASPDKSPLGTRRIAFAIFIVLASLITPVVVIGGGSLLLHYCWFSPFPLVNSSFEPVLPIKDNQLWCPVLRLGGFWRPGEWECELSRMDLSTGQFHESGAKVKNELLCIHWQDDQLYLWSDTSIYQLQKSTLQSVASVPAQFGTLHTTPFVYDGQITMVVESADSRFRLQHLVKGDWRVGREIRLPSSVAAAAAGPGWAVNVGVRGRAALAQSRHRLSVIQQGTQTHLFLADVGWDPTTPFFAAYREGFEFADSEEDVPSALTPCNTSLPATGWESLPNSPSNDYFYSMTCDRDGCLFTAFFGPSDDVRYRFLRRQSAGQWADLTGLNAIHGPYVHPSIVAGSAGESYLTLTRPGSRVFDIFPIEGQTIHSEKSITPSQELWDRLRKAELYSMLLIGVLSYPGILILGTSACVRRDCWYRFGQQQARLASPMRRSLAWLLDWGGIFALCLLSAWGHLQVLGLQSIPITNIQQQLTQLQFQIENDLLNLIFLPMSLWRFGVWNDTVAWHFWLTMILAVSVDTFFILWCFKVHTESRHGTTLGKWLCGIQTVQTTLRPCSLRNAIVRDVLLCIDVPFGLTPIPAALSMMSSSSGQRWGDHAADTIVIRQGTIQTVAVDPPPKNGS